MPLFHTSSARRREVRRSLPRQEDGWTEWLNRRDVFWAGFWALVLAVAASLVAFAAQNRNPYVEGEVVPATIVARVDFLAKDLEATNKAREDAAAREPAVYTPNQGFFDDVQRQFNYLASVANNPRYTDVSKIVPSIDMPQEGLVQLRKLFASNGQPTPEWTSMTQSFLDDLSTVAILPPDRAKIELDEHQRAPKIVIETPGHKEIDVYRNEIFSRGPDETLLRDKIYEIAKDKFPKPLPRTIVSLIMQLPDTSDYVYNKDLTTARKSTRARIEPPVEKTYHAEDVIVPAGHKLSPTDVEILERERKAYAAQLADINRVRPRLAMAGLAGIILIISLSFWAYILAYNPRIARNPTRGLAFTGLTLLALGGAVWSTLAYPTALYCTAILPTLMLGLILSIAYDRRFAIAVGALHALLIMITLGLPVEFGFALLVGLVVAVAQMDEVRTLSKLPVAGLWSGLAMGAAVTVAGLATRPLLIPNQIHQIRLDSLIAAFTGLAAGGFVLFLLPMLETVFKVTTAMTLTQRTDSTQPLLRRLAQEAPGTYQHSLRIADMSEAAAETIGANGLLCKVGALFHDIGKINKPDYFIENQGGGPNRHEKLSPAMSLLIIVGHVKDGIEMAREYKLPTTVRQFIETHHGTTLVEYFYHAAKQQRDPTDGPAPSEFEFRYPGPKPQTREAAILMLCDCVESASRTLPEPTPVKLEQLVHTMAQKRLTDGQFDECSITLQELHKIEASVTKTLIAAFHGRIAYPTESQPKVAAAS